MRISAKARYGLATMIYFAAHYPHQLKFTVSEISDTLQISKIYLEQVFTQLRMAGLVQATKGPQGGYSLSRSPLEITAYDILSAAETSLFDPTPATVGESAAHIEQAMTTEVFGLLDETVRKQLSSVTLQQLADQANANNAAGYMYYL
jgi:Rrf2 family protein